jgi:MFS family permease
VFAVNSSLGYLLLLPAHHVAHLNLVGLPSLLAATTGGLFGACIGLSALLGGWAIDRWGPGRLDLPAAALMAVGVLALIFASLEWVWLAAVYILAGGLGRGALGVSAAVLQARIFAGPHLGKITGLLDLGFGAGAFAGPYLAALSRDLTGSYGYGLATAILAGFVAAGGARLARSLSGAERPSSRRPAA